MKERQHFNSSDLHTASVGDRSSSGRSIAQILQEIVSHISEIIRSEIRLATTEIKQDLGERAKAATYVIIAGVLILYGGGFALLGVVYAMATIWPAWLSAIAVGAVTGVVGAVLFFIGRGKMKQRLKVDVTTKTAEENLRWLKNQAR